MPDDATNALEVRATKYLSDRWGRDLNAAERAELNEQLVSADGAAIILGVRRVDVDHLIRAGLIRPAKWVHTGYARGHYTARYRAGDVLGLESAHTDIDWAAVRTTDRGRPSPLRTLPDHTAGGGDR